MIDIKLSVLILTHNRPNLFKRCVASVILDKPEWAEIIVNNDSKDIEEINGPQYFYEKHEDLSDTYKFLWNKSIGKYVYFLEDDDFVNKSFWGMIDGALKDANENNIMFTYIPENNKRLYFEYFPVIELEYDLSGREAIDKTGEEHFQLGQVLFFKKSVSGFVSGNILENDLKLFLKSTSKTNLVNKPIYTQTTDGLDNISWPSTCKDYRFMEPGGVV